MTPVDRIEAMFWGFLAVGCAAGIALLLWRVCEVCRVWWLR